MSVNGNIYNALVAKATALFPEKKRLSNPYELADNVELILKDAWGLRVEPAEIQVIEFCRVTTIREFVFVLTKNFATIGSTKDAFDSVSIALMDEQELLVDHLSAVDRLQVSDIEKIDINEVGPIDFKVSGEKKILTVELRFKVTSSKPVL